MTTRTIAGAGLDKNKRTANAPEPNRHRVGQRAVIRETMIRDDENTPAPHAILATFSVRYVAK